MTVTGLSLGGGVLADLARINCRYLLEWHNSSGLYRAISLPLPPRSFSIVQDAPSLVTYTLDGPPVRELGAFRRREVTLTGSAGFDARVGYNREGAITVQAGPVILREFRAFLEDYQREAARDTTKPNNTPKNKLIFRALDEDYHLAVEIGSFDHQRDAEGAHFAPDFVLRLSAYDDAVRVRPFESLHQGVESIRGAIDGVNAAIGLAAVAVEGSLGVADLVLSPLDSLRASAAALDAVGEGLRDALSLPSDVVNNVANTALRVRNTLTSLERDFERFPDTLSAQYQALKVAIRGADDVQSNAEILATFTPIKIEELENDPLLFSQSPSYDAINITPRARATVYRLRLGESLYDIALRFFGVADQWSEIAELNGWLDPFRLASGRLAQAGDLILIPVDNDGLTFNQVSDLYGEDLKLKDGDLVLDGDFQTISGPPNLEQGVKLRLLAINGETPIFEDFGLPSALGLRLSASSAGYLSAHVNEQLLKDQRVESVRFIELTDKGDSLTFDIELTTSESAHLNTLLSFEV